jgi:hypothetical protein
MARLCRMACGREAASTLRHDPSDAGWARPLTEKRRAAGPAIDNQLFGESQRKTKRRGSMRRARRRPPILGLARLGRLCRHGIFCKCGGSRHYEDSG